MIRFKYGLPEVTISSLSLYTSAILEANLLPPPEPKAEWRDIMAELSDVSCKMYRGYVRENKDFVPYFRSATPGAGAGQNCRWVRVRQNVVQPAASSRCAPFRGSSPGPRTA
ncbi:Phosphoenolpyruvate carboxylase [Klebsiella pneumoniae IS43]|uniref:Phosphoenolpyruvate carboxylase n=1 Tax=Klebsiella pneumoniae IS43 TaxID=1432552 RepID=W1DL23_KLEPN|nr:Phosphoenolpyruvate carboxylase [Klebsiella pneumoniae IS43]